MRAIVSRSVGTSLFILGLLVGTIPLGDPALGFEAGMETDSEELTLRVGSPAEMSIRNLLPARADDEWTSDVLFRIYDSAALRHPTEDRPMAWIAKGVDFDEDGVFESSEYDKWAERAGASTPLQVVVYYDFSGVRWHDGTQMTPWDLFFSYHISAMNSRFNTDLRVLFPNGVDSGYEPGRQLNIQPFDADGNPANGFQRTWDGEAGMFGGVDSPLRMAVQFDLTTTFALFYESTISPTMLPMHVWSRTGGGRHTDTSVPPDGPDDYGCAIWIPQSEASARGIPECGTTDPSRFGDGVGSTEIVPGSRPFNYLGAESWVLTDQDVIGHGPFKSLLWIPNVEAKVERNDDFYTGIDATTGQVYDARLASILSKPTITGIRFKVYTTTQVAVFALTDGQVDVLRLSVVPDFLEELVKVPEIVVEANSDPGFAYMGYNLRKAPWGYEGNNPSQDIGYAFRQAISHVVHKQAIVQNLLQNYGVIGHGVISPANTLWYNDNISKPGYDLARANAILDDIATPGGDYYDPRFSLDPPGVCDRTNPGGCRSLPGIGRAPFDIMTPQADYDPVRASASALIADGMRQVGINAQSKPTAFREIVASVNDRNFDIYIHGWRIGGTDPDYLFSFFHSSNAGAGGQNHPGFNNATFDAVIEASRAELDRDVRRSLIFQAQAILADQRPYEVLYYRTNIEAYRKDRFINWTVDAGTVWNYWSLIGIHPPDAPPVYTITIDTVPSNLPVSVDGVVRTAPYDHPCSGETVTIGAPDYEAGGGTRYQYAGWSDGGARYHDVSCNANAAYQASFRTQQRVVVDTVPAGMTISVNDIVATAPFTFWCAEGTHATLGAPSPQLGESTRFQFTEWSDDGLQTHDIACDAPVTIDATFAREYRLDVASTPSGIGVTVNGGAVEVPHSSWCGEGTTVSVEAPAETTVGGTPYRFRSWSDGGGRRHEIDCSAPVAINANFDEVPFLERTGVLPGIGVVVLLVVVFVGTLSLLLRRRRKERPKS